MNEPPADPGEFRREEVPDGQEPSPDRYAPFEPRPDVASRGTSPGTGWLRGKLLWVAVGVVVVLAGVFAYIYIKRTIPFRISGDRIIVRDSSGGALEIDTRPELPEAFPSDVPVYPDSELLQSAVLIEVKDPEAEGSLYRWAVPGPLEDIAFWFEAELALNGWTIRSKAISGNDLVVIVTKETRGFVLTFTGVNSQRTEVSLVFAAEFGE